MRRDAVRCGVMRWHMQRGWGGNVTVDGDLMGI
jgi:hypothetical protein